MRRAGGLELERADLGVRHRQRTGVAQGAHVLVDLLAVDRSVPAATGLRPALRRPALRRTSAAARALMRVLPISVSVPVTKQPRNRGVRHRTASQIHGRVREAVDQSPHIVRACGRRSA